MLSNPSQLLVRNAHLFEQGQWLLANAEDAQVFSELDGDIDGFHQNLQVYSQLKTQDNHEFAVALASEKRYDGIVLYMPKAKEHAAMLLANLACHLKPGGCLMLVGENNSGVKSAPKLLADYGHKAVKLDAARHCSLFNMVLSAEVKPFNLDQWAREFELNIAEHNLRIYSLPGIFSHKSLDDGTKLLLENLKPIPTAPVLDFACGAGIIGVFLAKKNPAIQLTMSDVSAIAVHCAGRTAEINGVKADVLASDGLKDITRKFAAIYTNPPFHTGTHTDYSITEQFLRDANAHLGVNGSLTLVANAFLDYPPIMEKHLAAPLVMAHTTRFKLYHCQK